MKINKSSRAVAAILCLIIFCSTIANASDNMVELYQERNSFQNISSESASVQAKTVGKSYSVRLPFNFYPQ